MAIRASYYLFSLSPSAFWISLVDATPTYHSAKRWTAAHQPEWLRAGRAGRTRQTRATRTDQCARERRCGNSAGRSDNEHRKSATASPQRVFQYSTSRSCASGAAAVSRACFFLFGWVFESCVNDQHVDGSDAPECDVRVRRVYHQGK